MLKRSNNSTNRI